jgi:hypothetical protein
VADAIKVRVSALEAIKPEEVKSLGNLLELQASTCGTVGWQEIYLPIEIHLKKGQRFDYYAEMRRLSDEVGATPFFLRYISLDGLATT